MRCEKSLPNAVWKLEGLRPLRLNRRDASFYILTPCVNHCVSDTPVTMVTIKLGFCVTSQNEFNVLLTVRHGTTLGK